ncbi:MAG: tRNA lysidine(34) synthetase TilS [Clostridia bacterium]|nr:tRNA lysidine(34) synthetase TilS [Clostridia bacterium]
MQLPFVSPHRLAGQDSHTPVLLAFSGGADSRALLHLLAEDAKVVGYPLLLAHVNHGIRGVEALRDRDFCQRVAREYGLELCLLEVDVPRLAKEHGRGLEEEARAVRYEFFSALMQERGIPILATAHHADDHLETLLFRLSRGTTPKGMGGILPARPFETGSLVRPLLKATRRQILEFCAAQGLEYVTDSTNGDPAYARNRLRAEVIPVLEELFARPQERALELSAMARQDEDYFEACVEQFLNAHAETDGVTLEALRRAAPSIRRRAVAAYVQEKIGQSPEQIHVREILELIDQGHNGGCCSLPKGWEAVTEGRWLRLLPPVAEEGSFPQRLAFSTGTFPIPGTDFSICVEKWEKNTKVHNLSTTQYIILNFDFDIIDGSLFWRLRREGDTLPMGGMTRRLRKLYNQKQIPPRLRERLPLLCDGAGILWAPLVGARDGILSDPSKDGYFITLKMSEGSLRGESEG